MKVLWVILNETKDAIVEVFETDDPNSRPHWPKFFEHRAGCVFCGRKETHLRMSFGGNTTTNEVKWYYSYFYWEDQARWGYSTPDGVAWSAAMALPEPIKMLQLVGGLQ